MLITTDITNLRFRLLNFRAFANFFANLRPHANLMQILPLFLNFLAPFLTFYYIRTKMKFTSCGTEFANLRICLFNFRTFVKNSQTCEVLYEVKKRKKNEFFFFEVVQRFGCYAVQVTKCCCVAYTDSVAEILCIANSKNSTFQENVQPKKEAK